MTLIDEVKNLMDDYWRWLRNNTFIDSVDSNWVEITTPYLDRHNDNLDIFVTRDESGYLITDDGYIIGDLESSGCDVTKGKRRGYLDSILNGYGVELDGGRLIARTDRSGFANRKHGFIQAMQAIDGLFYTSKAGTRSLFMEDVSDWLRESGVHHTSNIMLQGRIYSHHVDFIMSETRIDQKKRVLQIMDNPTKDRLANLLLMKEDLGSSIEMYVMINDDRRAPEHGAGSGRTPQADIVFAAAESLDMNPVLWSDRDGSIPSLSEARSPDQNGCRAVLVPARNPVTTPCNDTFNT